MMSSTPLYRFIQVILLLTVIAFTVSCSKTPDVRLTLCQDLTKILLGSPADLQWKEETVKMPGYNDLEMRVPYEINGSNGSAVCYFSHEAEDVEATSFNDPASAYSTYPNKMILKDKPVDQKLLAKTVDQAMLAQGKQAIQRAKEGAKQAVEAIKKEIQK
jgi:hypothetical protein